MPDASLLGGATRGANAESSAVCYLLPTACAAAAVGDTCASASSHSAASGDSATSCVGTASGNSDAATRDPANIGATAAVLVARVTISSAIVRTATGYDGSPADDGSSSDDGTATDGTTSNCCTTSNCATTGSTAANCSTTGAAALAPD
jgi:hypothetical protein